MSKMPAGAISSEAELKALIERAKRGERINLYYSTTEKVEGVNDRFRLIPDATYRFPSSEPERIILISPLSLPVVLVPGQYITDYVFSNYWYALAWRHRYLKSKGYRL